LCDTGAGAIVPKKNETPFLNVTRRGYFLFVLIFNTKYQPGEPSEATEKVQIPVILNETK